MFAMDKKILHGLKGAFHKAEAKINNFNGSNAVRPNSYPNPDTVPLPIPMRAAGLKSVNPALDYPAPSVKLIKQGPNGDELHVHDPMIIRVPDGTLYMFGTGDFRAALLYMRNESLNSSCPMLRINWCGQFPSWGDSQDVLVSPTRVAQDCKGLVP